MKALCWLGLLPCLAMAQEVESDNYGYSYFTLGFENIEYEELSSATSSVTMLNPVLNSGGLYKINDQFDFSIDALATFSPQAAEEEWRWNGQVIQHNQIEYLKTATNIQLHYKLKNGLRVIGGPSLTYQTYTRYGVKNYTEEGNKYFYATWKETSTDVFIDVGLAFDDATLFNDNKWHVSGKAIMGLPVWSITHNTQFEDVDFYDFGFRAALEGVVSYEVSPGLHLGWFVMFGFEKRFETDSQQVTTEYCNTKVNGKCTEVVQEQNMALLPEANTYTFSTGLQALWNF